MAKKGKIPELFVSGAEEYLTRIRSKYDSMSDAEQQIARFFLEKSPESDEALNIKDIALRSGTSIATVVRFCKTLGFKGFSEFKYSVQNGVLAPLGGELRIGSNDEAGTVKQKVAEYTRRNIGASIQYTDSREIKRAIDALDKCGQIIIGAIGTATGVAMAAVNAFTYIGIPCYFPVDVLTMLRTVNVCKENDIVIGISNCGYNKDVIDVMKLAKERGAVTIGVSGFQDSLMSRYTDILLATKLEDNSMALDIITVAICQLLTLQAVQIGYLARHSAKFAAKMKNVHKLNDMTRYALDLETVKNTRVRF